MPDLRIEEVTKRFGVQTAVDKVSFTVKDGEFVVLVGPSGCGKSTILRMIAGLEEITEGEIHIGARRVNGVPPRDRDVAMVFQSYALYPYKSVAENIAFPLRMRKEPGPAVGEKVARVARVLGLEDLLDRLPRQLSGGQRQRVAMGRAIVRDPSAFLFDEPLSNLDAQLRMVTRGQIRELQRRLSKTTVFVTHDQVEAMTMADRIVVLRGGRVEQIGAPLDLYDRPANAFVARFIGSPPMNFIEGALEGDEAHRFRGPDGIELTLGSAAPARVAGEVTLGVRPEHLAIVAPDAPGAIAAEVVAIEPTGAETVVVARRGAIELMLSTRTRPAVGLGERIGLGLDDARVHLFGPDGRRLDAPPAGSA